MVEGEHIVYILRCGDDSLYTGYTNNLARRIQMHQTGKGAKYTRGRGPLTLVYVEQFTTKQDALKREYAIKQLKRKDKDYLIQKGVETDK